MSNRYKCDISASESEQLTWRVISRHGVVWSGTVNLGACEQKINYTIATNPENASAMPRKAISALVYKVNRLIINSIRNEVSRYIHNTKYGINRPTIC